MDKLKMLQRDQYQGVNEKDPIRYYYWPIIGAVYRKRVEMCLDECKGGKKVLEVGFGTGISFINLSEKYEKIFGVDLTADTNVVTSIFKNIGISTQLQNGDLLNLPYEDDTFDTVLLISILEHLKPSEQLNAFNEIYRVLKPGGQVVYGVPVERRLMVLIFNLLGVNIREHHFSTEVDVYRTCKVLFKDGIIKNLVPFPWIFGSVYQIGNFLKPLK